MRTALAAGKTNADQADEAQSRLGAIGVGYLRFAQSEPGLFRTAFCRADKGYEDQAAGMAASPAFQLLSSTLDALVAAGLLPADRRPYAEIFAWSTMHGLAMLLLDGPLSSLPDSERERAVQRCLEGVLHGLVNS